MRESFISANRNGIDHMTEAASKETAFLDDSRSVHEQPKNTVICPKASMESQTINVV